MKEAVDLQGGGRTKRGNYSTSPLCVEQIINNVANTFILPHFAWKLLDEKDEQHLRSWPFEAYMVHGRSSKSVVVRQEQKIFSCHKEQ